MLRLLKQLVMAFKPISDAESMKMNLNGPQPGKKRPPEMGEAEIDPDGSIRISDDAFWDRLTGPSRHDF